MLKVMLSFFNYYYFVYEAAFETELMRPVTYNVLCGCNSAILPSEQMFLNIFCSFKWFSFFIAPGSDLYFLNFKQ